MILLTPDQERQLRAGLHCSTCDDSGIVRGGYPDYDALDCPKCGDGRFWPGPVVLVIEGDPPDLCGVPCPGQSRFCQLPLNHDGRHETAWHDNPRAMLTWNGDTFPVKDAPDWPEFPFVAPQRWRDLTGPCPTCDGSGQRNVPGDWFNHEPCPDCRDGRKRVELCRSCGNCGGNGRYPVDSPDAAWWACEKCDDGSVLVARCCVEVLPVVQGDGETIPDVRCCVLTPSGRTVCCDPEIRAWFWLPVQLDRVPVPGRDFIVVLSEIELP